MKQPQNSSFNQIATDLNDVEQILKSMESQNRQSRPEKGDFVAPRTSLEEELANICASLLELDKVSIHDEFLDLGGNSLLATQAVSRIRKALNVNLTLREFLETKTIATLAKQIETSRWVNEKPVMGEKENEAREEFEI